MDATFDYKGYKLELSNVQGDTPQKLMTVYDSDRVSMGSALAGPTTNMDKIVDAAIARKEAAPNNTATA